MKINHIVRAFTTSLIVGMALVACSKGYEYVPAAAEDNSKTVVSADMAAERSIDADGADLMLPFVRNNTSGSLDVNIFLDDPSGLFSLVSQTLKFESGAKTAYAAVKYSYDALDPEKVYDLSVGVSQAELTSEYMPAAFPVSCKKAWQNLGTVQWYDDWWTGGPFEKRLLKAPDGTETYRLMDPWPKDEVEAANLEFVSAPAYLEFKIGDDGLITYAEILNMGFKYSGMTCHMMHPSKRSDAASVALNVMLEDGVAQFCWYPIVNYNGSSYSWWGRTSYAYISFPGGPDLNEWL